MPVLGKQQGHQLRMNCVIGPEVTPEEPGNEVAVDGGVISWEMDVLQPRADPFEVGFQFPDLGGFPRTVQTFQNYKHFDR